MKVWIRVDAPSKKCKRCGYSFKPNTGKQVFCTEKCQRLDANIRHKEKKRHGGVKEKLIKEKGRVCARCGKIGDSSNIQGHHITGDNQDHEHQELLCLSCHAKHHVIWKHKLKSLDAESIFNAIQSSKTVEEASTKLGVSRSFLRKERKRLGIFTKPCRRCGEMFTPSPSHRHVCMKC